MDAVMIEHNTAGRKEVSDSRGRCKEAGKERVFRTKCVLGDEIQNKIYYFLRHKEIAPMTVIKWNSC